MAGHLGDAEGHQQNLEVIRVDVERQLLLVKGRCLGRRVRTLLFVRQSRRGRDGTDTVE